jgi:putative membrane protein
MMSTKPLLFIVTASALALAGCNNGSGAGADGAANVSADAAAGTDSPPANANVQAATLGQNKPVNELEDATAAAVGLGSAAMANDAPTYVPAAAMSDLYEIESSKLAVQRASSPAIKKFAQQMITDHTATTAKLKATLKTAKLDITPPQALDSRRQGMIDNLKATSAADFDKTYVDQQTNAHREAITLHSGYAEDGENAPLKQLAASAVPIIRHHLDMVQKLDQTGADGK